MLKKGSISLGEWRLTNLKKELATFHTHKGNRSPLNRQDLNDLSIQKYVQSRFRIVLLAVIFSANANAASAPHNVFEVPISLQFVDIEVAELLQILAKIGQTNFLLSDSIKGKITVDLNQTPWQTALHSILAGRGLRLIRNGDIYWIGPYAEISAFQKHRREDAALLFGGDHINSPRQILIEARIVEADERFARELGTKLSHQADGMGNSGTIRCMEMLI
ncbi:secretin and TonB N-terminal domain-containing protein [Polynucleobacter necessarius]|uniref:secretin and TonB N-terminal domain-containing protein n=1 Tax=Polynucleobacter necessarius TaxID=576610 RepID=UPI0018D535D6|nr:secretin and TonB N-terminal domain-containing protein [Polynucleobacter necessarius]